MVKQFTIPCQFKSGSAGSTTARVTFYIGHPDDAHHPIHFQSEWLSGAKGGVVSQDLMDTLGKLHDLAKENGVDFENLCYYALISATEHSVNGVTQDEIHKYADEFVKKENLGIEQDTNILTQSENDTKNKSSDTVDDVARTKSEDSETKLEDSATATSYNYTKEDEDLLLNDYSDTEDSDVDNANGDYEANQDNNKNDGSDLKNNSEESENYEYSYSKEDEDLLLSDDLNVDDNDESDEDDNDDVSN